MNDFKVTNVFILCDLLWKVQKNHAANRDGSFNANDYCVLGSTSESEGVYGDETHHVRVWRQTKILQCMCIIRCLDILYEILYNVWLKMNEQCGIIKIKC